MSFRWSSELGLFVFTKTAIVVAWGRSSPNSSSRFGSISLINMLTPVIFPPGRCTLVTRPTLIGSEPPTKTIGMVVVAALAAKADTSPPIVLTLSPPIVEGDVLTFNKAFFVESLANDRNERSVDVRRTAAEQSNHRKRTLLRPCRERPRGHGTAKQLNELASFH